MEKEKNRKKFFYILIQIIIYALVGYYIFVRLSDNWNVFEKVEHFSLALFLFSIFIFSFHSLWNGFLWYYILNSKKENLSLIGQIDVYVRSHLLRYIPGNVVGIFSRAIFNKVYGVPMLKSFFAWCYENLIYLIVGSVFASLILFTVGQDWLAFGNISLLFLLILLTLSGVLIVFKIDWFEKIFTRFVQPRLPKKIKDETELLKPNLEKRFKIFLGFVFSWCIYSFSFLILVFAIDPLLVQNNFLALISINALAWVLGYLSFFTPSGTGIREWVMIFTLESFLNIDIEIAIVISLFARLVFILGELLGFGMFFVFKYICKDKKC